MSLLHEGYACTVTELASGENTRLRGPVGATAVEEVDQADPWVLRSSLQCGDQWMEVTEVFSGIV